MNNEENEVVINALYPWVNLRHLKVGDRISFMKGYDIHTLCEHTGTVKSIYDECGQVGEAGIGGDNKISCSNCPGYIVFRDHTGGDIDTKCIGYIRGSIQRCKVKILNDNDYVLGD